MNKFGISACIFANINSYNFYKYIYTKIYRSGHFYATSTIEFFDSLSNIKVEYLCVHGVNIWFRSGSSVAVYYLTYNCKYN